MKNLINTAMRREQADLILKNGHIVDVFTRKIFVADIAIKNGIICGVGEYNNGKEIIDVSGKYVMPGFIDSHMHIESSMVTPAEYAAVVMPHGVTTVIADPHEITNVCGEKGLEFMKKSAETVPLEVKFMLPSCVPSTGFEHSGASLTAADTKRLAKDFHGIAEMMNYPGIISCDEETLGKLQSEIIDGHAPLLGGNELDAYLCAGIKTDHECSNPSEMLEKLRKGMYISLREGTLSKDLSKLVGAIDSYTLRRCTFCTDDRFVGEVAGDGSIDYCIKKAAALGIDPIDAIIMSTLNSAECYNLKRKGAIAPSYDADIVVSETIVPQKILMVIKGGKIAAEDGKALFSPQKTELAAVTNTVHLDTLTADFFNYEPQTEEFTAIELVAEAIITKKTTARKGDKLSKVCVIERHHSTGFKGFGFVTNYGITDGAVASSVGHDSHNITVIGDNDEDMALAVNTLGKNGGIAVCSKGKVLEYLPLDIAGLMSSKPAEEVIRLHSSLHNAAKELNISEEVDPFLSLAFLSLPVIPEIRVTDMGLFDVTKFDFVKSA